MPQKMHKLAALRALDQEMRGIERWRRERMESEKDAAVADREAAQMALTEVLTFFQDHQIECMPLVRLVSALAAVSAGSKPTEMLTPEPVPHRRRDGPTVELIKGRLAAIMEFQQQTGMTRTEAGEWVARHIPPIMKRQLGGASWAAPAALR